MNIHEGRVNEFNNNVHQKLDNVTHSNQKYK